MVEQNNGGATVWVDGQQVPCALGRPLLNALLNAGLVVPTACGGIGVCHLCRVRVPSGQANVPPVNPVETRALGNVLVADGVRLACQIVVAGDMTIKLLPLRSRPRRKGLPHGKP